LDPWKHHLTVAQREGNNVPVNSLYSGSLKKVQKAVAVDKVFSGAVAKSFPAMPWPKPEFRKVLREILLYFERR
jgi:hypothetical protein